jgi:hypothetical protein
MESLIDLIIEAFGFLDAAFDIDGLWEFRKVFLVGFACFLTPFNSYILGSIPAPLLNSYFPLDLERILGFVREPIAVHFRRFPFRTWYSLTGYHSMDLLSLSSRISS